MIENFKQQVRIANQRLVELGIIDPKTTFGNLSAIDDLGKYILIKPSGIPFDELKDEDISILDLNGNLIEGKKPSSDTPTHLELYKAFPQIKSIIHTHSQNATAFAQAKKQISCLGTTHADYFKGAIPITRDLTEQETSENYESNTGKVIIETFNQNQPNPLNPLEIPACLVASHGPFCWGESIKKALDNAYILELITKMNLNTSSLNPNSEQISKHLLNKHYFRKHGKNAYYGQ